LDVLLFSGAPEACGCRDLFLSCRNQLTRTGHKQIYFAHKRVCGTNPFRWPSFSEKEVIYLDELLRKPTFPPGFQGSTEMGPGESKLECELRKKPWKTMAQLEAEWHVSTLPS